MTDDSHWFTHTPDQLTAFTCTPVRLLPVEDTLNLTAGFHG
eukprot:CAMPEP_0198680518 /NCGR_PEP_ID=MMETSP1468-20131203/5040_1 /TAXON_ID=1461545 /ORGANISM="Mantoniella sp, Strain CCMP1436" /LENGTH=40 /DNA_ID= /DNA_START= /DNA_END= /DNA_ORIENTATION=